LGVLKYLRRWKPSKKAVEAADTPRAPNLCSSVPVYGVQFVVPRGNCQLTILCTQLVAVRTPNTLLKSCCGCIWPAAADFHTRKVTCCPWPAFHCSLLRRNAFPTLLTGWPFRGAIVQRCAAWLAHLPRAASGTWRQGCSCLGLYRFAKAEV
jgi:hypothetical protein